MRAHLARHARRLLVHRVAGAPARTYTTTPRRWPSRSPPACTRSQRRTFLQALFQKPPRQVRDPEYEPGWMAVMVWRSRMLDKVRTQPRRELMDALRKLFEHKLRTGRPLNRTQALQCRRLLEHLEEHAGEDAEVKPWSTADVAKMRQVLEIEPYERSKSHVELAKIVHKIATAEGQSKRPNHGVQQWSYLVRILARHDASMEALEMVEQKIGSAEYKTMIVDQKLVVAVAEGLARQGEEKGLLQLLSLAEKAGFEYDADIQEIVVPFFANQDRISEAKEWFAKSIPGKNPRATVYRALTSMAQRNRLHTWGLSILSQLQHTRPRKKHWEESLRSRLVLGQGISEVADIASEMSGRDGPIPPTASTINSMMRAAVEHRNLSLAEQISLLSTDLGLEADGETFLILWQLYLDVNDLNSAKRPYLQVQYTEPWGADSRDDLAQDYERLTNRYLVALSQQSPPDFPFILKILESVEEQQVRLSPSTVATLCLRFLENEQHFDVMDVLAAHSFLYSAEEREVVQTAFVQFCLDPNTSTSRAWGCYQLLQQYFQDLSFENRCELMEDFLKRKRSDMASHTFGHMRAHRNKSYHPNLETYIRIFEGLAQHPHPESLAMVHNMLKMDTAVHSSTRLSTALMLAHAGCDKPLSALDYWNDITTSREGPSYASLEAVFWALERKSGGSKKASEIWDRLVKMDVDVPPAVYRAYVGAMAASSPVEVVMGLVDKMQSATGEAVDAMVLAIAYNALPGQELQKRFEEWAKSKYRFLWADLNKVGRKVNEYSLCQFKIERVHKA